MSSGVKDEPSNIGDPPLKEHPAWVALGIFVAVFIGYGWISRWHHVDRDYFVPLAKALLEGHLDVRGLPPIFDELAPANGKWYVVFPFLPAFLVMPWVILARDHANQLWPCLVAGALNAALMFDVARNLGQTSRRSALFATLLAFGTIHWYGASDGGVWHFAQISGVTFLLLAIREAIKEGPPWRVALWLGCSMLCRLDDVLALPFFLAYLFNRPQRVALLGPREGAEGPQATSFAQGATSSFRARLAEAMPGLVEFCLVLSWFVIVYLRYNTMRFGNPFVSGYALIPGILEEPWYRHGILSYTAIPRNLHALFLTMPGFSARFPFWRPFHMGGLSLLITTPAFVFALLARGKDRLVLGSWGAIACIAGLLMLHGEQGGAQFGYRYAMDFYPFLMLLTLRGMGARTTLWQAVAMLLSFGVNAWGIWAMMSGNWA